MRFDWCHRGAPERDQRSARTEVERLVHQLRGDPCRQTRPRCLAHHRSNTSPPWTDNMAAPRCTVHCQLQPARHMQISADRLSAFSATHHQRLVQAQSSRVEANLLMRPLCCSCAMQHVKRRGRGSEGRRATLSCRSTHSSPRRSEQHYMQLSTEVWLLPPQILRQLGCAVHGRKYISAGYRPSTRPHRNVPLQVIPRWQPSSQR